MEDNKELQRAIALSLEEATRSAQHRRHASTSEDDGEEAQFQRDLQAALEASKAEHTTQSRAEQHATSHVDAMSSTDSGLHSQPSEPIESQPQTVHKPAFLGERAQLEKERLERLKCRGSYESEVDSRAAKRASTSSRSKQEPQIKDKYNRATVSAAALTKRLDTVTGQASAADTMFWNGEIRQTANKHVDQDKNTKPTFRLSEIIGKKADVSLAIISSFSNQFPWVIELFNTDTPVILVNHPEPDGKSRVTAIRTVPNWLVTMPFLRGGRGCMHVKLMLIFYKDERLRVVVPTANFMDYDWRDIENSVWVQDIPIREDPIRHDAKATDFPGTLQRVLQALNVPAALKMHIDGKHPDLPIESVTELRMRWDWSKVTVKLVASLAGRHSGWDQVTLSGHPALMKAIQEIGARAGKKKELTLECQGSSIGSYSTQWMNEFYCSAKGSSARTWLDEPKSRRTELPWPSVKIIYPSLQTVKDSVFGTSGGGTIFCQAAQWRSKNFPREMFHDSNSKRGRVLMHSKMIIGLLKDKASTSSQQAIDRLTTSEEDSDCDKEGSHMNEKRNVVGWAYVGSHNFTQSAWGTLSGSSTTPSLNISNFEMGIVFPLYNEEDVNDVACWKRPARKYVVGKDRAWIQGETR